MDFNFLDDPTLWVAISFIIFLVLSLKPILNGISDSLEKKIIELKKSLDESINLKNEADKLYKQQLVKQKENELLIKRIQEDTKTEVKKITKQIEQEIESNMIRKINNFDQMSKQMEHNLKTELKSQITEKVIAYTEYRIKKELSKKHNEKLVENSLKNIPKQLF